MRNNSTLLWMHWTIGVSCESRSMVNYAKKTLEKTSQIGYSFSFVGVESGKCDFRHSNAMEMQVLNAVCCEGRVVAKDFQPRGVGGGGGDEKDEPPNLIQTCLHSTPLRKRNHRHFNVFKYSPFSIIICVLNPPQPLPLMRVIQCWWCRQCYQQRYS